VNFLSVGNPRRLLKLLIIVFTSLIIGLGLLTPAQADTVGEEFDYAVLGNVKIEGEAIGGVRMVVEGSGYSAETVTAEDGSWLIGVPNKDVYTVTLDESTLPAGIVVLEGEPTQEVELGRSDRVVKNFFIGEGERNEVSFIDQFISRLIYGVNFGLMLGLASVVCRWCLVQPAFQTLLTVRWLPSEL